MDRTSQKWIVVLMLIGFGALWLLPSAVFGALPKELTFEPLKFDPPKPEERVLSNGMTLYLLEDHELPLFNINALIKTGDIYDTPDKVGLASIFASVMRTGGTVSREPDALNEELESMAASVEIGMNREFGTATLSTLAEDIDKGLEIFADALRNPAFRQDKLELRKQQAIERIRRRNDNPIGVAWRHFSAILYGTDHPFGWYSEIEGVESITVEDLKAFHAKFYHPNNIMLSITGDFDTETVIAKLEQVFDGWEQTEVDFPDVPKVEGPAKPSINYIFKDLTQTTIWMGHFGIQRSPDLPDYFAIRVMNEILGESGFTSRLMREVREKRGLAYQVGSLMDRSYYTNPGEWLAYSRTRADKTAEVIELILDIIKDMRENPVSEEELQTTKDSLINSFVFGFESSGQIAFQQMMLGYRGFAPGYLETYTDNIAKVAAEDVLNVAKKYLHPDGMVIVAVGNQDNFDRPLSEFGEVTEIDISVPPPPVEAIPEASGADVAKAKEILVAVVDAHGGLENLKAVKNTVSIGRVTANTPMGPREMETKQSIVYPGKMRLDMTMTQMGMSRSYVFDGQSGWMVMPQGTQPLPGSQIDEFKKSGFRDTIQLLINLSTGEIPVQYVGAEDVNGKPTDVILVTQPDGEVLKLFIDQDTKYIIKKAYRAVREEGVVDEEEFTDDYREVAGVKVGYHIVTQRNGEIAADVKFNEIVVNAEVDESIFEQ